MANMFPTSMSISKDIRMQVIQILNDRLADAIDMKTQAKQAHWNVKGMAFYELHLLFDTIAGHLDNAADLLAERITTLGGVAEGTVRQSASRSSIPEYPMEAVRGSDHILALSTRLALVANAMRNNINDCINLEDQATGDIFIELVREADKDLWFLQSHLQA